MGQGGVDERLIGVLRQGLFVGAEGFLGAALIAEDGAETGQRRRLVLRIDLDGFARRGFALLQIPGAAQAIGGDDFVSRLFVQMLFFALFKQNPRPPGAAKNSDLGSQVMVCNMNVKNK